MSYQKVKLALSFGKGGVYRLGNGTSEAYGLQTCFWLPRCSLCTNSLSCAFMVGLLLFYVTNTVNWGKTNQPGNTIMSTDFTLKSRPEHYLCRAVTFCIRRINCVHDGFFILNCLNLSEVEDNEF